MNHRNQRSISAGISTHALNIEQIQKNNFFSDLAGKRKILNKENQIEAKPPKNKRAKIDKSKLNNLRKEIKKAIKIHPRYKPEAMFSYLLEKQESEGSSFIPSRNGENISEFTFRDIFNKVKSGAYDKDIDKVVNV